MTERPRSSGSVVTVGAFDGIHLGHAALIRATVAEARRRGLPSVVVTFSPHPAVVLRPERAPALLTTEAERREAIAALGADRMVLLPFTPRVAQLTAREFVEHVLVERLGIRHLVIGHDHALGRDRVGDATELARLGDEYGFGVTTLDSVLGEEASAPAAVSSTRVRAALEKGDVESARPLLGRFYWLTGEVVHGEGRGAKIGFPTANLAIAEGKLLPAPGIYAARAWVSPTPDGGVPPIAPQRPLDAAVHVGPRPVFDDTGVTVEAHLIDRRLDLYGSTMRLELVGRIRGVEDFDSVSDLVAAMGQDVKRARDILADHETVMALDRRGRAIMQFLGLGVATASLPAHLLGSEWGIGLLLVGIGVSTAATATLYRDMRTPEVASLSRGWGKRRDLMWREFEREMWTAAIATILLGLALLAFVATNSWWAALPFVAAAVAVYAVSALVKREWSAERTRQHAPQD